MADNPHDAGQFHPGYAEVARVRPTDITAPNGNDLRSFVHAWFAAFDHRGPAEFFLSHLDDADMTFNLDGSTLASDHASFRAWYADALDHFPWDFHDVLDTSLAGTSATGWAVRLLFRHVGEWRDDPDGEVRPFNRLLRADWRVEHRGGRFVIRRYELATERDVIPI